MSMNLKVLLFDATKVEVDKHKMDEKFVPRCGGIRTENGMEVTTAFDGLVNSFLGFISTFLHILALEVQTSNGVPVGLPALSEHCPLMKILIGIKGTKEDFNLTCADWYQLPNATVP